MHPRRFPRLAANTESRGLGIEQKCGRRRARAASGKRRYDATWQRQCREEDERRRCLSNLAPREDLRRARDEKKNLTHAGPSRGLRRIKPRLQRAIGKEQGAT
jgi:hypothetical protein